MLVACIGRTVLELCILSTALWPEQTSHWCQAGLFLVLVQLQTISSMLLVFVFQNTLLAVLASKIYLSKNYATSLHAMTKTRQIQTVTAIVFAPIQLALLFSAAPSSVCWPAFGELVSTGLISVLLVISPLLQLSTVGKHIGRLRLPRSDKFFPITRWPLLALPSCTAVRRCSPSTGTRTCTASLCKQHSLRSTSKTSPAVGTCPRWRRGTCSIMLISTICPTHCLSSLQTAAMCTVESGYLRLLVRCSGAAHGGPLLGQSINQPDRP